MLREGLAEVETTKGLKGKFVIYEDPKMEKGQVLLAKRGKSALDAGYVYAPYIPLQSTPNFVDPSAPREPVKTPLEEIIEGVFAEEIESGELQPVRGPRPDTGTNPCQEVPLSEGEGCVLQDVKPPFIDPSDFTLRKGLRTRFAKKLVNPKFFGVVKVEDIK